MPDEKLKPFLDIGRARKAKAESFSIRLPLAERLRAARRIPQAIVKVTSFSHGVHHVSRQLRYISRNGSLPLEKDNGDLLVDREGQKELLGEWALDFDSGQRSRDTASVVFSLPPGSKIDALRMAVRATATKSFPGHEWVFAIHQDRDHPHAHLIVKMRGGEKGQKLRLRKAELYRLRETFAEASRAQGVQVAASPRAARGVTQKGVRQAVYQMRRKGIVPEVDKKPTEPVREKLSGRLPKPWEMAMAARGALEKEMYLRHARRLRQHAAISPEQERGKWLKAAADLERFAGVIAPSHGKSQEKIHEAENKSPRTESNKQKKASEGLELG